MEGKSVLYWMDASFIEELRKEALKADGKQGTDSSVPNLIPEHFGPVGDSQPVLRVAADQHGED